MSQREIVHRPPTIRITILVALCATMVSAIAMHAPHLNGPWYWTWPWRQTSSQDFTRYYPATLACVLPLAAAMALWSRAAARRWARGAAIVLVMTYLFATQVVYMGLSQEPFGFDRMTWTVKSPSNTSYYWDAVLLDLNRVGVVATLYNYPRLMGQFQMHSQEKPPGPVLFFGVLYKMFGVHRAGTVDPESADHVARIAGFLIGALATLIVPAVYALVRTLARDAPRDAAFLAACVIATAPGLVLHFPMLDQLYPLATCALLIAWANALTRRSIAWASVFGLTLAVACFFVFHFLVLGAFLGAYTAMFVAQGATDRRRRLGLAATLVLVALATCAAFYLLLFDATGFNPIATFFAAIENQKMHLKDLVRPYPKTIFDDLQDFALGCGWLSMALTIFMLFARPGRELRRYRPLTMLCLGQLVLLAVTGLMQTETARTWCFLLPLVALPAGLELSRWPVRWRVIVVAMMWLILVVVGQNLKFIFEPTEGGNPKRAQTASAILPAS